MNIAAFFCLALQPLEVFAGAVTVPSAFGFSNDGRLILRGQPAAGVKVAESSFFKGALEVELEGTSATGVDVGNLKLQAPATVAFWMKPADISMDRRLLCQLDGVSTQAGTLRLIEGRLEIWSGQQWGILIPDGLAKKRWQHIAVVFNPSGKVNAYLNGTPRESAQASFDFAQGAATLGGQFLGRYGASFSGCLADIRILPRAMSASEIAQLCPKEAFPVVASEPEWTPFGIESLKDSAQPIRPGKTGEAPFWNSFAHQFIHAPAFDLKPVNGAAVYRFTIKASDNKERLFEATHPQSALSPVWTNIPVGLCHLRVEGLDKSGGAVVGVAGERRFYRAAPYNGPYRKAKPAADYAQSAALALKTLFSRDYFQEWMKPGVPPENFRKGLSAGTATAGGDQRPGDYAYPAKLIGQLIAGAALYARLEPRPVDADEVIRIGSKAGDLLLNLHLQAGSPMEFFPPTYQEGLVGAASFMDRNRVMLNYPAETGEAFLDFYEQTKGRNYLDAALKIADTYRKLQLPSGTWYQMMDNRTGGALYSALLVPVSVIQFLDRLVENYKQEQFRSVRDRAFAWVMENPAKTFNWQGQFEDGAPTAPYHNMSPQQACDFAQYLFERHSANTEYVKLAFELLEYAEDQFVSWETPPVSERGDALARLSTKYWVLPSVQEQYKYWVSVNFSYATLIRTYIQAFRQSGRNIHLAKAIDLANVLLVTQELHQGEYPTYPVQPTSDGKWERTQNVWFNCGVGAARAVSELAAVLRDRKLSVIQNHTTWLSLDGNPIRAHDGHLSRFGDRFYWYGISYEGNPTGQYGMARPRLWNGVQVYSSDNLVTWTSEGVALPRPEKGWGNLGTSGRPHVLYNAKTKKYVMWYWFHPRDPAVFQMVAVSDQPTGPFTPLGPREVGTWSGFASDHNVFQDDDGKAYLVYTDHTTTEGRTGGYAIRIDSLTDDYLASNKEGILVMPQGHEAPAMSKYKGKYLVAASGVEGWGGTVNDYAVADKPIGPWSPPKTLTGKNSWGGQMTSMLYLKESDTVLAMFDQWWVTQDEHHVTRPKPGATALNDSRYLWLPVDFDPQSETASVSFRKSWRPFEPKK
jgi:maltose/maltodextrin transport system substrate-binding protein